MTTQKAQSKIKSSTVAITVLSILLAIAVVSTIVLAAFTATQKASTTITFGGGLTMTMNMSANSDFQAVTDDTNQSVTIETTGPFSKDDVTMPALQSKTSEAAYVGWQIVLDSNNSGWTYDSGTKTFTNTTKQLKVVITTGAAVTASVSEDGVFYFTDATTANTYQNIFESLVVSSTTDDVNDIAGESVQIAFNFKAETVAGGGVPDNVQTFA